ncbi:MAG: carbon monoxide dehydrogenase subunit G [Aigarchaeota archaeon]|nr:carbon monoxide dehydrogenase subunit G [Aigarchaeota archaeon]MDW8092367.1 carbon monoxide dehydrogenase subunit G [Nitrososphaerota archaeon]
MKFEGSFQVNAPPNVVWSVVTNPNKFGQAIPDLKSLVVKDKSSFTAEFKVKLGMVGGTLKMDFKFDELNEPNHVKIVGRGTGVQSTVDLKIDLNLSKTDSGSVVKWDADVTVGGLVASIGSRLIESVTKDKVTEIITKLKKVIEGTK